jgi:hypothetical protein
VEVGSAPRPLETDDPLAQLEAGPIFVVGHMRSGTTWVFDVLSAHPQVAGLFESLIFTGAGVGPLLREMHWQPKRNEEIFGRRFGLGQIVSREQAIADVRSLTDRWLAGVLEPHHRFIVEKAPADRNAVETVATLYPEASIIHVLRDGRDVAVSTAAARSSWARPDFEAPPDEPQSRRLWAIGLGWARRVESLRQHGMSFSLPFHEVRYEDLHARPRETIAELYDFCGMPYDAALLDEVLEATAFAKHDKTGETAFRRKGEVGDWRNQWSRWERLLFSAAAGDALEVAGYAPPMPKRAKYLRAVLMRYERLKRFM